MGEVNSNQLNTNSDITKVDPQEEHSSLSSSSSSTSTLFVFQPCLSDDRPEETLHYQVKAPLCISQQYEEEFFDHFHLNYFGELEREGLFLASVLSIRTKPNERHRKPSYFYSMTTDDENQHLLQAIIRTLDNNYVVSEIVNVKNEGNILQFLLDKAKLSRICHVDLVHDIKANEKILEFDKYNDDQLSYKISILHQRLNQLNEIEILSNDKMSIEMENFLNLISELVQLKNFNKYRGDLDTKADQHGTHSYFTIYQNYQIMFNVAPIIPCNKNDLEFIQRKSLIGNALICIVFQEESELSFTPDFFLGKVTQVYIIVKPIQIKSELYYKIEIWRRADIEPIVGPSGGIFKHDESFRDYFLTLTLKTMDTILKKDFFRKRFIEPRYHLKNEYLKKLYQMFSSYSKYDLSMLCDNNNKITIENSSIGGNITSKNHRLRVIAKIIGKLNTNNRSKQCIPYTENMEEINPSDNTISPIITKLNPWISSNDKIKSISSMKSNTLHPISPMRVPSPLSLFHRIIRQEEEEDPTSKQSSAKTMPLLVTNKAHSVESIPEMQERKTHNFDNSEILI
ncbi:unnamed protein product [Rotaria sordida]|uniref:Rap-GAP domain-containing protein n=3 Tax=Rotaria sordida TaxID=392033 RepID=A0A815D1Q8_9BILA|nr:unnamed protein product [Rotaria sordida]CAF1567891.1 unnamed protein product [Rotaria sordida]